tara:strand:+ start:1332 stop:2003 length:672 start_codon:yes stop_codon:yes gene_type:complete
MAVKQKKSSETPVVAATPTPAPAAAKTVQKKKKVTETKQTSVTKTPVVNEVVATTTPAQVTDVDSSDTKDAYIELQTKFQQLQAFVNSMKQEFKALEKRHAKEVKQLQKSSVRRKKKSVNRAPSGFVKPTLISDELATFLNKEKGIQMARTDVTREINTYIREHGLQDKNNGRIIKADERLTKLLNLQKSDELTYFNLQKFMSPHFYKEAKSSSESSAPVATA